MLLKLGTGLRFIDLFCGIGAFHQALADSGAECVFASDIDREAREVYELNYALRPHGDITKIDEADIPEHDVLSAGFPCQAFSIAGRRLGFEDTRGTLFFDVLRIARHHKPRLILLENVKNLKSHDRGRTFAVIKEALEEIGYREFEKILDASKFGTPQKRERIFIVCVREDLAADREFVWPKEWPIPFTVRNVLDSGVQRPMNYNYQHIHAIQRETQEIVRVGQFGAGGQGMRVYSPLGLAATLCSGGGGGGALTGAYLVDGTPRTLTANECRRLTGFPDSFQMYPRARIKKDGTEKPPSERKAIARFGNSIPLHVVSSVFEAVLDQYPIGVVERIERQGPILSSRWLGQSMYLSFRNLPEEDDSEEDQAYAESLTRGPSDCSEVRAAVRTRIEPGSGVAPKITLRFPRI